MDFAADNLFDGRKLRMLTVVDCITRQSLAIEVGQSLKVKDVVRVLTGAIRVEHKLSRSGKSTANTMIESFYGRLRQECLNEYWFVSLAGAREKIAARQQAYSGSRIHSALDWRTPNGYARQMALKRQLAGQ
jgi:putative transposase